MMPASTVLQAFARSWWEPSLTAGKKRALGEAQKELNLPEHLLITECQTRWGSRQMMIERVLEQNSALSQVLSEDKKSIHLIPSWQDIAVLESVSKSLLEFTDALSGEEYVSVSYLKPVLQLFNTTLLALEEDDEEEETELTKSINTKILDYLNKKYEDPGTQELLDMASFLDPRFRMEYVSVNNIPSIKKRVTSEMEETARKEMRPSVTVRIEPEDEGPSEGADAGPPPAKKAKKSLGSFPVSTMLNREDQSYIHVYSGCVSVGIRRLKVEKMN